MTRDDEEVMEHESYAVLSFSRINGHPGNLFGSHLKEHYTFVRMTLRRARRTHTLAHDWYFSKGGIPLAEVDMSAAQFADLITTMNSGDGTPCTLRLLDGKRIEAPPDAENEAEKVRTSFQKKAGEIGDKLRKAKEGVEEILAKKTISVADRKEISSIFSKFLMEVEHNMPFMLESFEESTQKVVTHAKAEVDAFTTQAVLAAGLDALAKRDGTAELGDGSGRAPALPGEVGKGRPRG